MFDYFKMKDTQPPLDIEIIIKHSNFDFISGAEVVTFESDLSDDVRWHIDACGVDSWQFVHKEDYEKFANKGEG